MNYILFIIFLLIWDQPKSQQKQPSVYVIKQIIWKISMFLLCYWKGEKWKYILNKKDCTLIKGTLAMDLQMGGKVTNTYYKKMPKK